MENGPQVDVAEELKWTGALRDFTMNSNIFQCYDQVFAWMTCQYDLATYWNTADS